MDARITKSRITRVLSYDWIKMIAMVVAVVLVWSLLWTMFSPRASVGQTFDLFVYSDFAGKGAGEALSEAKEGGAFSYDVLKFGSRELLSDYYSTIMSAVTPSGEGDVMITSDFPEAVEKNESKARTFIDGYGNIVYSYDALIADAKNYCTSNDFVISNGEGGYSLNSAAIEVYFRKRMKDDPRFRTEEKILAGLENEKARIKKVWNDAVSVEYVLTSHPELIWEYDRYEQTVNAQPEGDKKQEYEDMKNEYGGGVKKYGVNLGKLSGGEKQITDLYSKVVYDDEGKIVSSTADGIIMFVFNFKSMQPDLQYESLGFVKYIISAYSNFIDEQFVNTDNRLIA